MKTLILALLVLALLAATQAMAQPTLGSDCPAGTTLVGSDKAGRLILGSDHFYTCTLEGLPAHDRACSAMNETNGGGWSIPIGARMLSATSFDIESLYTVNAGDVISYQCSTF